MKIKRNLILLLTVSSILCIKVAFCFIHQADGIILQPEKVHPSDPDLIKIQICDENIIHISAIRGKSFSSRPSLMVNKVKWLATPWYVTEKGDYLILSTAKINIHIHKQKGSLAFYDRENHLLLQEKANNSKIIIPAEVMGEQTYHVQQLFQSPADEAFYGLGQHQNGIMNFKDQDVDLWQYNCVAVIPFLVSSKNYGILWDNNSRTKFGDTRDYQSLSGLILYDQEGQQSGLTAEYFKSADMQDLFTSRSEPRIEHAFSDVNDAYPEGFQRNVQCIRWSGEIEPRETGIHKFRLYCSSFTKMWLNGKLVVDNWRQNWMPWTHFPKLMMESGKRYSIKIEWIHNGGFIDLKYLPPADKQFENTLSLYSDVGDQIDYYFIYGSNPDAIISGYRTITGKVPMMPKWAMGLWQCRERYRSQEELLSVVKEFRDRKIPLDNIVQDWFYWPEDQWGSHDFDPTRYPDAAAMVAELHEKLHTRIMISVWPKFYVGTDHYNQFNENGWLYRRNVEQKQRDWVGPGYVSTFYDPYNEDARTLFWQQINAKLFSKGFDAWWLDATEPDMQSNLSLPEWHLRMGPTAMGSAERYLNTYSLMNAKGIYEKQRETNPEQRVFILTRSAFAGQQRYAAATWSGDIGTRWDDLRNQIPAGLNFCLAGIPYWTTDIGGFAVEPRFERNVKDADLEEWRELNTRWFQFGTFCPLFRVHGQYPYREMFTVAPNDHPAFQTMLAYDQLRYRLMPYIYSLTGMVTLKDYTIMRALIMDFAADKNVIDIADQFMFGPAILVNPVATYKARSRPVYLPAGTNWYDFKSGNYLKGGQTIEADAPYNDIPLFIREGSIVATGPAIQFSDEKPADPIRLLIYTGRDGVFTLYEDENVNYNYEKGAFSLIPISYHEEERTLTIGQRQGVFAGMLTKRTFEIVWIDKKNVRAFNLEAPPDQVIAYDGMAVTVAFK